MINKLMSSDQVLEFNPIRILETEGEKTLYAVNTGSIFNVDEPTAKLLQAKGKSYSQLYDDFKDVWTQDEFKELIEFLLEKDILKNDSKDLTKIENNTPSKGELNIKSIVLFMIQECNLRCTYCYGEGGEYSHKGIINLDTAKKSVDFLFDNSKDKKIAMAFFGGEPLLNFGLIKDIVSYAKKKEEETGKSINFAITTNGTLLTDEITDFLIENKFTITISIDGCKELHDVNRFYANGKGTYDTVIKNTRRLVENAAVSARATITNTNFDMVKNFYDLYKLGFKRVNMAPCTEMLDDDSFAKYTKSFESLLGEYDKMLTEGKYKEVQALGEINKKIQKVDMGGTATRFCGSLSSGLAIDVNGNIYPCHRLVGKDEFLVGNVFEGMDEEKYANLDADMLVSSHDKCSDCWAANLCGGGCISDNYGKTGSIKNPNERSCDYTKQTYEAIIKYYVQLSDEKRKMILHEDK